MSELHQLCRFATRPITENDYLTSLKDLLKSGIPATYTLEEAYNFTNGIEAEITSTTTPLHLIADNIPLDYTEDEEAVICSILDKLFEYGAGWCHIDDKDQTPGCILIKRNLKSTIFYEKLLDAGVRAELLLRKVSEYDMEFIDEDIDHEKFQNLVEEENKIETAEQNERAPEEPTDEFTKDEQVKIEQLRKELKEDPSNTQSAYLNTKLKYKDNSLITEERGDGVMMSWEDNLMKAGCESLFEGKYVDFETKEIDDEINVLNIGFGMGIIDKLIQEEKPTKHYICEAHPDVLAKLDEDGWFDKENVVILPGRWQDQLPELLSKGIFFNGIYYDTYSEHYTDMLELFDFIVGLLKPHGIFSFFNGLGADREFIYDVYKKLVEIDLNNYGLAVEFREIIPEKLVQDEGSVWDSEGIRRAYWTCPVYFHPEAKFM